MMWRWTGEIFVNSCIIPWIKIWNLWKKTNYNLSSKSFVDQYFSKNNLTNKKTIIIMKGIMKRKELMIGCSGCPGL